MTKIAINTCYGGFSISRKALEYIGLQPVVKQGCGYVYEAWDYQHFDNDRTNSLLIQAIEELGPDVCNGDCADIEIVEIPDNVDWEIHKFDGKETIHEVHRTWH